MSNDSIPTHNTQDPADDIFNPQRDEPHLPGDGRTPASPPTDTSKSRLPIDDPRTDGEIDSAELYDEGMHAASGAEDGEETSDDYELGERV